MKNHKQLITLAAIFATCGLLLASCGGGSSGSSATTINGISVPPEPDATANNATLAGVDSNSNGVRDDVERKIAQASDSQSQFTLTMEMAKAQQSLISNNGLSKNDSLGYLGDINCAAVKISKSESEILQIALNSFERTRSYNQNVAAIGAVFTDELKNCSN